MPQNTFPLPDAGTNSVFTFLGIQDIRRGSPLWESEESVTYALNNPNDGVYVIDGEISQKTKDIAAATTAAGKPFVLSYTDLGLRRGSPAEADMETLAEALKLTDKIAIGTSPESEWSPLPGRPPGVWADFAANNGFTWVCPLIHVRLLSDIKARRTRDELVETRTPVFCLMGYALACYCLGKPLPSYRTSLREQNILRKYQLSLPILRDYLAPLYAISGAGGVNGLRRGTRRWCEQAGFDGTLFKGPTTDAEKDTMPAAASQPADLGRYEDLIDPTWT